MGDHKRPPKNTMTGGRLMNLLAQHGYVSKDPTKRTSGLVMLSKLTIDGVTANQFLTWTAYQKNPFTQQIEKFQAIETDLCDLNEKLIEYSYPPLVYEVKSEGAFKKAIGLINQFGKKIIDKL